MKKSALALLVAFSFVSCSREDNNSSTTVPSSSTLVGVWKIEKTVILSGKDNQKLSEIIPTDCQKKLQIEFEKEGKYTTTKYDGPNDHCVEDEVIKGSYTYDIDTRILKMKHDGEMEGFENKLVFIDVNKYYMIESDNYDHNNDGTSDKKITYYQRQK